MQQGKCFQCNKQYTKPTGSVGCLKCAPGVHVVESEFRKPIINIQPCKEKK